MPLPQFQEGLGRNLSYPLFTSLRPPRLYLKQVIWLPAHLILFLFQSLVLPCAPTWVLHPHCWALDHGLWLAGVFLQPNGYAFPIELRDLIHSF